MVASVSPLKEFHTNKFVVTLAWEDESSSPHITMLVVMAVDARAAQVDVLKNWPLGKVFGTIAYTAEKFVELAERFRDDVQPDPPWMRVSQN